jgi:hypothetical protein
MTVYKNFSHKDRNRKEADAFASPELIERSKDNELITSGFNKHKERWREILSYFRLIINNNYIKII